MSDRSESCTREKYASRLKRGGTGRAPLRVVRVTANVPAVGGDDERATCQSQRRCRSPNPRQPAIIGSLCFNWKCDRAASRHGCHSPVAEASPFSRRAGAHWPVAVHDLEVGEARRVPEASSDFAERGGVDRGRRSPLDRRSRRVIVCCVSVNPWRPFNARVR